MSRKQVQNFPVEPNRPMDITLFIDSKFTRFTATNLRGQILIGHFLDEAIEVDDLLKGLNQGHLQSELRAVQVR